MSYLDNDRTECVLVTQKKYDELIRQSEQVRILKNIILNSGSLTVFDLKTIVVNMEKKEEKENDY